MDGKTLRDGIFALYTRRFGTVSEVLVKRLVGLGKSKNLFHDLYDDVANQRVEVKFSVVRKKAEMKVTEATVLQCIAEATNEQRMVSFSDWESCEFDSNIQQVKLAEFEVLYYGLFFSDCILVFRIRSADIGPQIYYSDKQHKGNIGEGQFHINDRTLQIHLDNHLYQRLTYDQFYEMLSE